jgi:urease accessory protein
MGKTSLFKTLLIGTLATVTTGGTALAHHLTSIVTATTDMAEAHHPMGGVTPSTFSEGLLSGFGHPIIGLDHLAFVIGVGLVALMLGHRFTLPLAFIGATIAGVVVHLASISLPAAEVMIALSVLLIGSLVISGKALPTLAAAALFAIAGLFHGFAYGEAIFGAETTPLLAYFLGFAIIQYGIAVGAGFALKGFADVTERTLANIRIAGGLVAGVGLVFVAEALMPF